MPVGISQVPERPVTLNQSWRREQVTSGGVAGDELRPVLGAGELVDPARLGGHEQPTAGLVGPGVVLDEGRGRRRGSRRGSSSSRRAEAALVSSTTSR